MNQWRSALIALGAAALLLTACGRSNVDEPAPPHRRASANPEAPLQPPGAPIADAASGSGAPAASGAPGAAPRATQPPILKVVQPGQDGKLPLVSWDFRDERNPSQIGWPRDQGNNKVFALDGDFQFSVKVQDKKDFDGRVRHVETRRDGGLIDSVEITEQPEATEPAYLHAKDLLNHLGFANEQLAKLDAWHDKAKAGNYDNLDIALKNSYNRVYTVHLTNDGTSDLPWSLGLDIDWSRVCGCHG